MKYPEYGVNRRHLDRLFRKMGGSVRTVPRTGEVRYVHPDHPQRPRANGRRKDAPNHLVNFVREVLDLKGN